MQHFSSQNTHKIGTEIMPLCSVGALEKQGEGSCLRNALRISDEIKHSGRILVLLMTVYTCIYIYVGVT